MENRKLNKGGKYGWWTPIARVYEPIQAGSIDGTDTIPHDRAIIRALKAEYHPNKLVVGNPRHTIFVGRLSASTTEDTLKEFFSRFGKIERCRLVRDVVTGYSKRYAFIEFEERQNALKAYTRCDHVYLEGNEILVEMEVERTMPGWVPRRLGGGWGGKKESGQLRFGGRARKFQKPLLPLLRMGNQDNQYPHYDNDDRDSQPRSHRSKGRDAARKHRRSRSPREYYSERDRKYEDRHHEKFKYRKHNSEKHSTHPESSGYEDTFIDPRDESRKYHHERHRNEYSDNEHSSHLKRHKKKYHKKRSKDASSEDSSTDEHPNKGDEGSEELNINDKKYQTLYERSRNNSPSFMEKENKH